MTTYKELKIKLESIGEDEVRDRFNEGLYSSYTKGMVDAWLKDKASNRRDSREEATLSIAKEANDIARKALDATNLSSLSRWKDRIIAITAVIIATIAASDKIKSCVLYIWSIIN